MKTLCHVSVLFENGVQGIILLNIDRKYVIWVFDYQKLKILILLLKMLFIFKVLFIRIDGNAEVTAQSLNFLKKKVEEDKKLYLLLWMK